MKFNEVTSSNIKQIAFEDDTLYVTFKGGTTYTYEAKEEEFNSFLNAPSKGKFFHANIKGRPYKIADLEKLNETTTTETASGQPNKQE
jgi:hypothetical protein